MKKITKNNLLKLVEMKKKFINKKEKGEIDEKLKNEINEFIENVINKDEHYYRKLSSYKFDNETLDYLL